jgi:hypothetical protein
MTTNRVALITGASSGIGYATTLAFARQSVHVAAVARRFDRLAQLAQAVGDLPAPHGDLLPVIADVQKAGDMYRAVEQTVERFGRLDILVANAGLGQRGSLVEAEWDDLETVMRTNMDGVLHSVRAAVPALRRTRGQIIFISSVSAHLTMPYAAIYAASKAFVSSIARSLRLELEPDGITITDMLVGRTNTEFNEKRLGQSGRSQAARAVPVMTVEQVAGAIVQAAQRRQPVVILRPFDRLLLLANKVVPGVIGRLALRQYKSD